MNEGPLSHCFCLTNMGRAQTMLQYAKDPDIHKEMSQREEIAKSTPNPNTTPGRHATGISILHESDENEIYPDSCPPAGSWP